MNIFPDGRIDRCVTIGGVAIAPQLEPLHLLIAGATGTGKTALVSEILSTVVPRGDRVIACDPNGYYLSIFGSNADTVLNPFDRRSPGWSIFNEVRRDFDFERLARSIVPDGHGADRQWHFYAQVLLTETMRALMLRGEGTSAKLMHWLAAARKEELAALLGGTPAQGLFDADAGKALASTRFILTAHLNSLKHMHPGEFSIRDWVVNGRGNLYVTWLEDMQAALRPLISAWIDIVANAVLSLPSDDNRRVWLVLDELGALGMLSSLESALTRGRKHGLCVVAGLQSTAQLDRIYGRDGAIVLRSCFRNLVIFSVAKSDPDTSEMLSRALGDADVERPQHSVSAGQNGITRSSAAQRVTERIVLASEISQLPNLHGYLALAGEDKTRRIRVKVPALAPVQNSFEE